jgi:hypothetical protein
MPLKLLTVLSVLTLPRWSVPNVRVVLLSHHLTFDFSLQEAQPETLSLEQQISQCVLEIKLVSDKIEMEEKHQNPDRGILLALHNQKTALHNQKTALHNKETALHNKETELHKKENSTSSVR